MTIDETAAQQIGNILVGFDETRRVRILQSVIAVFDLPFYPQLKPPGQMEELPLMRPSERAMPDDAIEGGTDGD